MGKRVNQLFLWPFSIATLVYQAGKIPRSDQSMNLALLSRDEGVQKRGTTKRFLLVFCEDTKGDISDGIINMIYIYDIYIYIYGSTTSLLKMNS